MARPHISPSQLRQFSFCEQQWHFRYVMGLKSPPGIALIKGSGTHKAAEANNRQKIDSHVDLDADKLAEIAVAEIDQKIMREGCELTPDQESKGRMNVIGEMKDTVAYKVVPTYAAFVAPTIQPVLVEEEMRIELPDHSHDLFGILDCVDDAGFVRDLKTTGRSKGQGEADNSLQLSWYAMAYNYRFGKLPTGVTLDVVVETKVPKAQRLDSVRDENDIEVLLSRVNNMMDRMAHGAPPKPAPIGDPMCSMRFCGYAAQCPYFNSTRKAAAEAVDAD